MEIIDKHARLAKFGGVKIGTAVKYDGACYIKTEEVLLLTKEAELG